MPSKLHRPYFKSPYCPYRKRLLYNVEISSIDLLGSRPSCPVARTAAASPGTLPTSQHQHRHSASGGRRQADGVVTPDCGLPDQVGRRRPSIRIGPVDGVSACLQGPAVPDRRCPVIGPAQGIRCSHCAPTRFRSTVSACIACSVALRLAPDAIVVRGSRCMWTMCTSGNRARSRSR